MRSGCNLNQENESRTDARTYLYIVPKGRQRRDIRFADLQICIVPFEPGRKGIWLDRYQKMKQLRVKTQNRWLWKLISRTCMQYLQKKADMALTEWTSQWNVPVFWSEKVKESLPVEIKSRHAFMELPKEVYAAYGLWILEQMEYDSVSVLLPEDAWQTELDEYMDQIMHILLKKQDRIADLIFFSWDAYQTQRIEGWMDWFLEETGIAATCYERAEEKCFLSLKRPDQVHVVLDLKGISASALSHVARLSGGSGQFFYLDACGASGHKQLRRLTGLGVVVKSLGKNLDRGFPCGL